MLVEVSSRRRRVGLGEVAVAESPEVLVAYGLGSCIAVALYDPVRRLGALGHVMLAVFAEGPGDDNPLKYADHTVGVLVARLEEAGAARTRLEARIAGGASMFPELQRGYIGERNAAATDEALAALGVAIVGRDVGGHHGRTVELHTQTGALLVRSHRKGALWL